MFEQNLNKCQHYDSSNAIIFLLGWDEKVCDGTLLGTEQGSDGKRLGLGGTF